MTQTDFFQEFCRRLEQGEKTVVIDKEIALGIEQDLQDKIHDYAVAMAVWR
jgi:hypothetical protein